MRLRRLRKLPKGLRYSKKPCPVCNEMGLVVNKAGGILCHSCRLLVPSNNDDSCYILDSKTGKRLKF